MEDEKDLEQQAAAPETVNNTQNTSAQTSQEQAPAEPQQEPLIAVTPKVPSATPQADTHQLTTADGTDTGIARDSALQADAISPDGEASISFESGNWNQFSNITNDLNQKITTVQKTIMPLIEVALIELLGNNKAYTGTKFNSTMSMVNEHPSISCSIEYKVENWIGTDIKQEDIMHDAKYVLDRINIVEGVQYNQCEINCTEGTLSISFVI